MGTPLIPDFSTAKSQFDTTFFLEKVAANDANGNPTYIGYAMPGTATSAAGWYITKQTYDGNDALLTQKIANDAPGFIYVWDSRATYF